MTYQFQDVSTMTEMHLLNTIRCIAETVTEERKKTCKLKLIKRWQEELIDNSIIDSILSDM